MPGAVDLDECPRLDVRGHRHARNSRCNCLPKCSICGEGPHVSLHGPAFGCPPGSKPWDHEYAPEAEGS
jgi:hypothetical protein